MPISYLNQIAWRLMNLAPSYLRPVKGCNKSVVQIDGGIDV